ncbi:MAG: hypothetical protein QNJ16_20050 [Rhodobacter sp.]|nr:hypothetical protein [Rhodobacter sp.]
MTREDYVALADCINTVRKRANTSEALKTDGSFWAVMVCLEDVANEMCGAFKADNNNFSRDRFMAACGLGYCNDL